MDKQWVEVELAPVVVAELAAVVAGLVPVVAALERVLVPAVAAEWAAAMRPHNHNRRAAGPLSLARLDCGNGLIRSVGRGCVADLVIRITSQRR